MGATGQEIPLEKRKVHGYFFFPPADRDLFGSLDTLIAGFPQEIRAIAQAFRSNIAAVVVSSSLPFAIAHIAVSRRRYQQLFTAEMIRAGDDGEEGERRARALQIAQQKLNSETASVEGTKRLAVLTVDELEGLLNYGPLAHSANETLRQGLVLAWGSFGVLATDLFIAVLNRRPSIGAAILKDADGRKWFSLREAVRDLEEYGFNLSDKMGVFLSSQRKLDDVPTLKSTYRLVFPSAAALHTSLASKELWVLQQRRNLIVHRRGVVDAAYVNNTGDDAALGDELIVKPKDLEAVLRMLIATGCQLLDAAAAEFAKA